MDSSFANWFSRLGRLVPDALGSVSCQQVHGWSSHRGTMAIPGSGMDHLVSVQLRSRRLCGREGNEASGPSSLLSIETSVASESTTARRCVSFGSRASRTWKVRAEPRVPIHEGCYHGARSCLICLSGAESRRNIACLGATWNSRHGLSQKAHRVQKTDPVL